MILNKLSPKFKKTDNIAGFIVTLSLFLFLFSYRTSNFDLMIVSCYVFLIGSLIKFRNKNALLYIFFGSFFIFLINRSFIDIINGYEWISRWNSLDLRLGLSILYGSLVSIYYGYFYIYKNKNRYRKLNKDKIKSFIKFKETNISVILLLLLFVFIVSFVALIYVELDKFIYMQGKVYEEYYLSYVPTYNGVVKYISDMYFYLLCLLLSFKVTKRFAFILLFSNILTTIPVLLIGQRGAFITALLFAFIYYMVQTITGSKQKWFTKYEISLIVIAVPFLIILMLFINEFRSGRVFDFSGLFSGVIDFFHKQGVSFDAVMNGVKYREKIFTLAPNKNFMFGEIIEYFKYNPISLKIFGTTPLPSGNNAIRALRGNSYAHILSYLAHHSYLKGYGFGTSYVLEVFQTYGFVGLVIVNMLLGVLLRELPQLFSKNQILRYISIIMMYYIFYLPRQPFSDLIFFMIKPGFWLVNFYLICIYLIIKLSKGRISKLIIAKKITSFCLEVK